MKLESKELDEAFQKLEELIYMHHNMSMDHHRKLKDENNKITWSLARSYKHILNGIYTILAINILTLLVVLFLIGFYAR